MTRPDVSVFAVPWHYGTEGGTTMTVLMSAIGSMGAAAIAGAILMLTGCTSSDDDPSTTPTADAPAEERAAEDTGTAPPIDEPPVPEDEVDLGSRDVQGEPAPPGMVDMIEGMSIPDGAVTVTDATMISHKEVYYVVAALADTPDGTQILTYLHAPFDQADVGNGGETQPLNEAAQQWAPLAPVSDDMEALELGDRLIVGQ